MADVKIRIMGEDKATTTLKRVDSQLENMRGSSKRVIGSWTELASKVTLGLQAFSAGKRVFDEIIGSTVDYAFRVDDLSRSLSINTEEASKLIQIADDLRIPIQNLQFAFRQAQLQGINPNIQGLKDLAKEYQSIVDPVAKAQFALQKFGSR